MLTDVLSPAPLQSSPVDRGCQAQKWFLSKYHSCRHASQRPGVQRVLKVLQIFPALETLDLYRRHVYIMLLVRMIKLRKTAVDQPEFPVFMLDNIVVRLHIAIHSAVLTRIIQCLE